MSQQESTQSARDRQALLEFGGGLRGRMAGLFCVLETSVDAVQRYLAANADEQVQKALEPVLEDMLKNIASLSRLSANAADMALACAGGFCAEKEPMELNDTLKDFACCVNEEFTARALDASFTLDVRTETPQWVMGDSGLIDGVLVNLISNSLQACHGHAPVQLRLTVLPGRELLYTDNGPEALSKEMSDCLRDGGLTPSAAQRGTLGLLLIHEYAKALEWRLRPENGPQMGFRLRIFLPEFTPSAELLSLQSGTLAHARRENVQRTHIRRELDGIFGTNGKIR